MNIFNSSLVLGLITSVAAFATFSVPAQAGERYATPPNIILSSNLTAPWLMQMSARPIRGDRIRYVAPKQQVRHYTPDRYKSNESLHGQRLTHIATPQRTQQQKRKPVQRGLDPRFLPQIVNYQSEHKAGTIIISTNDKYLYLVMNDGQARRYGVGVGKQGFTWSGTQKITRKAKWPGWTPPAEMIAREKKKGRILPAHMPGGPENPLGARALYLGSTMYRIHGTTQPWSIGLNISSGCIRMRNEDVTDLYQRVKVGTKVVVL